MKALFAEAVAGNKISPELIAANTNLAAYVAQIQPRAVTATKQGTQLMQPDASAVKNQPAGTGYQSKLVPPPDPVEAALLTTFSVSQSDLETLAASRAKTVQAYFLQTGKVEAARLFLKDPDGEWPPSVFGWVIELRYDHDGQLIPPPASASTST